jgi:hypothetical protein
MSGHKILESLRQAAAGNLARVTICDQLWVRHAMPDTRCRNCDAGVYAEWSYCPFCGEKPHAL